MQADMVLEELSIVNLAGTGSKTNTPGSILSIGNLTVTYFFSLGHPTQTKPHLQIVPLPKWAKYIQTTTVLVMNLTMSSITWVMGMPVGNYLDYFK